LTGEQADAVLACCRRPREHFLLISLRDTGLRIGEALGLRRDDMHLLPDSRSLGCPVLGAHVHVRHRANPNGALAKSRFPRTVPASDAVLAGYGDYQHERSSLVGGDGTEMVLVNLYHAPVGAFLRPAGRRVRLPGPAAHAAPYGGHQLGPGRSRS
jgi:integrase